MRHTWVCCLLLALTIVCMWSNAWMLCFAFKPFFFGYPESSWLLHCQCLLVINNNNNSYLIIVISLYFPTNLLPLTHFFLSLSIFSQPTFLTLQHNISHFFDSWLLLLPKWETQAQASIQLPSLNHQCCWSVIWWEPPKKIKISLSIRLSIWLWIPYPLSFLNFIYNWSIC
jgi:hypothetical protein